jgi:putative NADH-flavin reductase
VIINAFPFKTMADEKGIHTYAILGSTGNTGTALLQNLERNPNARVNAYCRNRIKLLNRLPDLKDGGRVNIFEGSIDDQDLMMSCLRGCRAVFLCVSTNDNKPGCCMAQNTAKAVIDALRAIRAEDSTTKLPKLVLLSSGTVDVQFRRNMPSLLLWVLLRSASNVYNDIWEAEKLLRDQEAWLTSVYIKPAMLSVDVQRGHKLDMKDQDENPISYLDLAAGMIEAADDEGGLYDGMDVSVVNTAGHHATFPSGTPMCILVGLLCHYFPWLFPYLPAGTGPS